MKSARKRTDESGLFQVESTLQPKEIKRTLIEVEEPRKKMENNEEKNKPLNIVFVSNRIKSTIKRNKCTKIKK